MSLDKEHVISLLVSIAKGISEQNLTLLSRI